MRPPRVRILVLGLTFVMLSLLAGAALSWVPRTEEVAVELKPPPPHAALALRAEWPQRLLLRQPGRVRLVASRASTGTSPVLAAELAAPGLSAVPAGEQVSPAPESASFTWTILAASPGAYSVVAELSARGEAARTVLWARAFTSTVESPLGLNTTQLRVVLVLTGALGAGLIAAWSVERRAWRRAKAG